MTKEEIIEQFKEEETRKIEDCYDFIMDTFERFDISLKDALFVLNRATHNTNLMIDELIEEDDK